MVSVRSSELGPLGWNAVTKHKLFLQRVSSRLGPGARQQGRGAAAANKGGPAGRCASGSNPAPSSGTGPPGQGSLGPLPVQTQGSVPEKDGRCSGSGSPTRTRQNQGQIQGIPKARAVAERASGLAAPASVTPSLKPFANQLPGSGPGGRLGGAVSSKLPVKGLSANPGSSALGSNGSATESSGTAAANKASAPTNTGPPEVVGAKPEDRPSRSALPVGAQNVAKPPSSPTTASSNSLTSANSNAAATAATKVPGMRSRALSLQARTTTTGLKAPAVTNHIVAKTLTANQAAPKAAAPASQAPAKQSQYHLQRSGSARFSRLNTAVDKNKPRGAPARPITANTAAPPPVSTSGSNQNQQQPPPELVSDPINTHGTAASVFPVSTSETTNTVGSTGTTATSGFSFRARAGSRSSPKTCSRLQNGLGPASKLKAGEAGGGCATVADQGSGQLKVDHVKEQTEKKNQGIQQLRKLLVQGNKRVEALATVIQHLFSEREETLKQKKELSLEIAHLRDELVLSSQSCARLQTEKEEARVSLEETLKKLEEQHKEELAQLEDRLRSFYQTEWDKVHQAYQEEADKCRTLMEQQVEELMSRQEVERKNQEASHSQKMESLRQQYETSVEELKRTQLLDLENLEKTLKETEASLSEKIAVLSSENEALSEKLRAEEERRKRILTDKNLKDSHTVYLEQELESLKVVLEIKNTQLHQKEKKLMEMDKLVESNVKLEECLTRVQQENEDYKARMDKHAALSKQLSSEQAMLQQNLQKESKVNKRLSMENEELLWKLHNGDLLASPRRLSPTSPRSSAYFPTSTTLSPR
ncbi:microtubule-associated tumor suppressor 1-like [Lampris incognitus]|uniref:microtubule-associated tumor suppressor 1-like n=1 Tax=Lampris incognitus TaxID=2546036 RepID=UPI0024B4D3B7|nr:microtubule-associated tumor suppressor 1-like [Lampris incognitus]